MCSVPDSTLAKLASDWIRCLLSRFLDISRAEKFSPFFNTIFRYKLQSDNEIWAHEFNETFIKRLTSVLLIKFLGLLLCKPSHFDVTNCKSIFFNNIDNFSCIHITIRFDHGECFSFLWLKLWSCELVCIVCDF